MTVVLKRLLPILLALCFLTYALKDVSFAAISQQFQYANYAWISLSLCLTLFGNIIRGKRWQQSLLALRYHSSTFRTTIAMQSGVVASMIVPGSGEFTRCATIQRTDGIPLSQGLGSVVAEFTIDFLMLGVVMLLALLIESSRL